MLVFLGFPRLLFCSWIQHAGVTSCWSCSHSCSVDCSKMIDGYMIDCPCRGGIACTRVPEVSLCIFAPGKVNNTKIIRQLQPYWLSEGVWVECMSWRRPTSDGGCWWTLVSAIICLVHFLKKFYCFLSYSNELFNCYLFICFCLTSL